MSCEYPIYNLSSIIELIGGGTPKTSILEYWNGDIPWLSVKDFNNDSRYVYSTEKHITELGLNNSSSKLLKRDDIIISARGTVGELAMIPYPMAFNQSCYALRGKPNFINQAYLYYFLKRSIRLFKNQSYGSVFDTITKATFENITITLPPLAEQKAIADVLSCLDDKIENNRKIIANLEAQAQAIYKNYFVDFEPFAQGEFTESELGPIPQGWRVGTTSDFGKIVCGKTPPTKNSDFYGGNMPFITIPDMHNKICCMHTGKTLTYEGMMSVKNQVLPKNSICVSCIATPGLVCLTNTESVTNQQINSIIPTNKGIAYFLLFHIKNMAHRISHYGSSGSVFDNLSKSAFSNIEILYPKARIMEKFHHLISPFIEALRNHEQENARLTQLRDTLLPKLMSGEVRVPVPAAS